MFGWIYWDLVSALPACMNGKTISAVFQQSNYVILTEQKQTSEKIHKLSYIKKMMMINDIINKLA